MCFVNLDESDWINKKQKPKDDYQNGIIKVSGDSFLEKAIVYNKGIKNLCIKKLVS